MISYPLLLRGLACRLLFLRPLMMSVAPIAGTHGLTVLKLARDFVPLVKVIGVTPIIKTPSRVITPGRNTRPRSRIRPTCVIGPGRVVRPGCAPPPLVVRPSPALSRHTKRIGCLAWLIPLPLSSAISSMSCHGAYCAEGCPVSCGARYGDRRAAGQAPRRYGRSTPRIAARLVEANEAIGW